MERAAAGEEILVTRRGKPTVRLGPAARSEALRTALPSESRRAPEAAPS
jgi:prevent-host-death family protein